MPEEDNVEKLAAHAHDEQWSGWMKYLFGFCHSDGQGGKVIPAPQVERWMWQMNTPYAELPEQMKESDREEARAILRALDD